MHVLRRIETHLRRTGIPPARFGRDAMGDPRFVFDLRNGREVRASTAARLLAYLDGKEAKKCRR